MAAADEHVIAAAGDVHHVVRHESMPALDQVEHAFALADSRTSAEQETDTEDVGERAMHGRTRRERIVQERLESPVEFGRLEPGANDRNAAVPPEHEQLFRRVLALGDDDARQLVRQKRLDRLAARLGIERGEIRNFRFSQNVNAIGAQESGGVAGEDETGTRRLR